MSVHPDPPAEALDWRRVLAFLPELQDQAFVAGDHAYLEAGGHGTYLMRGGGFSERFSAFVEVLYDTQVVVGFDWPDWMRTDGSAYYGKPDRLRDAPLEDCRRLLAALVRGDRFNEGLLLTAAESGLIVAILERVRELVES